MKKLHLACSAHIDPAWLWRWNEGLAETISTFRVVADFCENYDGFVFNHNEALLYEWVEEHEPELFERIKKLVKAGKWKIIGGWYLQPDCVMTSGESLIEHINLGKEYFMEKFGTFPKTAINYDPFGHTRGLVQILKKNGYDGYTFMRPENLAGVYRWEGFDGSEIIAHSLGTSYGNLKGNALRHIKNYINNFNEKTIGFCPWGVGNHGGGPSKIDLEEINEFIKECKDIEVLHSDPDRYINEINKEELDRFDGSFIPCMVGCYTSMIRIKQGNRRLENKIASTEKIMNYAGMETGFDELKKAKKALAFCQFHDILPGTAIKSAEDDSLATLGYGEEITDKLYMKAFFKLCEGQKKAKDGEIPIMVFNPHPYEIEGEFEVGFLLSGRNWAEDEETIARVYDKNGNFLPTQNEKAEATLNVDWVKKISFVGKLAPSSVTRFDCQLELVKMTPSSSTRFEHCLDAARNNTLADSQFISVENDKMTARISKKTGLIDLYKVDSKVYIENSGKIEVYNDNEDPWGMTVDSFCDLAGYFELMSDAEANEFMGYPEEKISNVRVVEDGEVRTKVQAFFKYGRSVAVVEYTLPKHGTYIDVDILMYSAQPNKMIKYRLDTKLCGKPYGETAFGHYELYNDEKESVFHKWCGIKEESDRLYVVNKGIYGGSFTPSTIKLSLLRTPIYAAHPMGEDRMIAPHDRFVQHIDMGERRFTFRITTEENIAREAQIYNEAPQLLSFFPSGEGEKKGESIVVDNSSVILSSVRKMGDKCSLLLYNASDDENDATIELKNQNKTFKIHFGKHEFKTIETKI